MKSTRKKATKSTESAPRPPRRRFAKLRTAVPGPRSKALMARREKAVPRGPFHACPIFMESGQGALIRDVDGNTFLDFAGGLGCLNVGHSHPRLSQRIAAQLEKYLHSCFHVMPNEPYIELSERLNTLAPIEGECKTLLANSGAEGVENAVKIARAATGRAGVMVFDDAFHGRTLLGMTATSKTTPYKIGMGPFAPEFYRAPLAWCFKCRAKMDPLLCGVHAPGDCFTDFFKRVVDAKHLAAILVEPIQGEGGFIVPPPLFFDQLRSVCDANGIVLIADEVQAGMGRTGTVFASEQVGMRPDLIVSAKSLAGGLPLAAVTGRAKLMDAPIVGGLGGTYGGNPLACVAALEVLDLLAEGELLARAKVIEHCVRTWGAALSRRCPLIGEVRGLGGMMAIELVKDARTKAPAKEETGRVTRRCYENGLITISAGTNGNVIRTLMPLVISDDELVEGLSILEYALMAEVESR